MTKNQRVTYIISQSVCATIELGAMKVANQERECHGFELAYNEEDFLNLLKEYCIGHNDVMKIFNE